ncbi:hypothetical protein CBI36_07950 [Acetobacter oryzifermentans]|nr:hypothetical protein [Acetobacter tropicalis]ASL40379.1 hypothetical protein CBI36_07950 [Acetobacter oryzifermentans]ATI13253.1 hypothetical protein CPF11_13065 [Acetobacter pomorum]
METLLLRRIFGTKGEAALSLFQGRPCMKNAASGPRKQRENTMIATLTEDFMLACYRRQSHHVCQALRCG